MPQETNILNDGYVNFMGGVDSGNAPNELAGNQVAYATNITFRGGYAETRPGFKNITLTFERSEAEEWFKDYGFQGAGVFNDQIIASIGGRIFRIDPNEDWYVTEITPWGVTPVDGAYVSPPIGSSITFTVDDTTHIQSDMPVFVLDGYYTVDSATATTVTVTNVDATPGSLIVDNSPLKYLDPNSPIQPHAWMVQAEDWFIVQDGQSAAILYNGDSRRSSPSNKEVPSGSVMAYGQGRLWVAITPRNFVAGDINNGPSDVINFTENDYLGEGGFFSIPKDAGGSNRLTVAQINT